MIYIFTALYCEAQIFIKQLHLIKNQQNTWFQQFQNETSNIMLIITGVGEIAAAAVVSSVCSSCRPTQNDILLNVGICAHTAMRDGIFLCNKIVEQTTGRTFYPDMLFRHDFAEETIVTGMQPYRAEQDDIQITTDILTGTLYDMEAAAIYQTGIHFFAPHQMLFLKIISDRGAVEAVSKERIVLLMEQYKDRIFDFIGQVSAITQAFRCRENLFHQEEKTLIEAFCEDLHCSKAMKDSVKQYIRYLKLAKMDYIRMIRDLYEKKQIPCKDKREGKQRFEAFKRNLF